MRTGCTICRLVVILWIHRLHLQICRLQKFPDHVEQIHYNMQTVILAGIADRELSLLELSFYLFSMTELIIKPEQSNLHPEEVFFLLNITSFGQPTIAVQWTKNKGTTVFYEQNTWFNCHFQHNLKASVCIVSSMYLFLAYTSPTTHIIFSSNHSQVSIFSPVTAPSIPHYPVWNIT